MIIFSVITIQAQLQFEHFNPYPSAMEVEDVSIIDELPPNRKEIKTMHLKDIQRMQLYNFMKEQIEQGRQIYFVFPLIAESEKLDIENLTLGYEKLLQYFHTGF